MLKMNADPKLIRWERRKRQGFAPSPRTGGTMVVYKNRATLFGGVYDEEVNDEKLETVCYNEMYTYQCDTNKWYPLSLRLPKTSKKKKKAKKVVEQSVEEEEKKMEYSDEEEDDNENNNWENSHSEDPSNEPDEPEKPSPRYNAMMCVVKNHLYLYGGILEVGDREFTLDDFYSLNLDKLHEFVCIKKPNIEAQVWLGENSDDDDDDDDDEDDEDDENDEEGARGDDEAAEKPSKTKEPSGVAATGGLGRHGRIDRNALEELEAAEDTPKPGESLREFFERTNTYWVEKAYEETQRTGKALRRDGFQMAEERYIEFEPQLKEWEGILKEIEEREKREALEKKQQKEKSRR
ncbi:Kelch repeat-containing protein 3 [Basidiobolus ranarum]|uniref:Kelch repeat-containing protein 3 n=1 Tax=Basidiobolus ranarum TaxID=34480 RepID=A0ABR2W8T3_9FUNG